jgi:pimeloyl-ACP methyl ester carboxylesterase
VVLLLGALLPLTLAGCDSEVVERTSALFDLQTGPDADLYAAPFPNDARRRADGSIELARLGTGQPVLIQLYLDVVSKADIGGFPLNAATYFRFDGLIDPSCLPQSPAATLEPGAAVFAVNIQVGSPHHGERVPLRVRFTAEKGLAIGENSLAALPVAGFSLEPSSTYAVILTEGVCDVKRHAVAAAGDFSKLISDAAPDRADLQEAYRAYQPLRVFLKSTGLTGVVSAAVFTTGDPTALAGRARKVIYRDPPPTAEKVEAIVDSVKYWEVQGSYAAPNFQDGIPPYMQPEDGGQIRLDGSGDPKPARSETLRFALSVPKGTMPADGWPLVIYAHGTGGDYRSFVREGLASKLAEVRGTDGTLVAGFAVVGIDQNLHGPRGAGAPPNLTFFNFQNPVASVHNVIQAGIDDFSLLRMVKELRLGSAPWGAGSTHSGTLDFDPVFRIDPKRIYFMGHSQGGLTGPVFLAYEPEVKGAVLSGAGGGAVLALLAKSKPIDVRTLLQPAIREPLDEFHPVLNLIQQMLEPADTLNYGRMLISHRPAGLAPKHVFLSEGLVDHYTPNATTEALAAGIGIPQLTPVLSKVDALDLLGLTAQPPPLSGNVKEGGVAVTAGLLQYQAVPTEKTCTADSDCTSSGYCDTGRCLDDGHFVLFDDPTAMRQYSMFLATMARDGVPTIGP